VDSEVDVVSTWAGGCSPTGMGVVPWKWDGSWNTLDLRRRGGTEHTTRTARPPASALFLRCSPCHLNGGPSQVARACRGWRRRRRPCPCPAPASTPRAVEPTKRWAWGHTDRTPTTRPSPDLTSPHLRPCLVCKNFCF